MAPMAPQPIMPTFFPVTAKPSPLILRNEVDFSVLAERSTASLFGENFQTRNLARSSNVQAAFLERLRSLLVSSVDDEFLYLRVQRQRIFRFFTPNLTDNSDNEVSAVLSLLIREPLKLGPLRQLQ